jgi:hypothetical protein
VVNVVGLTIGPTGVALFTDYVFRDPAALQYSVACVAAGAGLFSTAILLYHLGQFRNALDESDAWTSASA